MPREAPDLDRQLKQLALEAQQHPRRSQQRRLALNRLCEELLKPGCLAVSQIQSEFDRYVYHEALSLTLLEVCQKIETYNPKNEVRQWCNFLLKKRRADVSQRDSKKGVTYAPKKSTNITDGKKKRLSFSNKLEKLDNRLSSEEINSESLEIRQLIEEDPDGMFSREYVRGRPDANLKFLALAHIWSDRTWSDIAEELRLPVQTIHGFFKKKMPQFYPYFKDYLSLN